MGDACMGDGAEKQRSREAEKEAGDKCNERQTS
jgi:hypothetical protein